MAEFFSIIDPRQLAETAGSYRYDPNEFHDLEKVIWNKLKAFPGGHTIIEHLGRATTSFADYLRHAGYEEKIVQNLAAAYLLHDSGKVMQDHSLYNLPGKPSPEVKLERLNHTVLGPQLLEQTVERFPKLHRHPHLSVIACFMENHHERINGKGPRRLMGEELGPVLEIAGIFDEADGKMKVYKGNLPQILRDMTGLPAYTRETKHQNEFRQPLLLDVIGFFQKSTPEWILPRTAKDFSAHPALAM